MRRLNILLVSQSLHYGGAETVIDSLYRKLNHRIFSVRACCLRSLGKVGQSLRDDGFVVDCVEGGGQGVAKYLTAVRLSKIIRENHIDIIHTHCTHSFVDGAVCRKINRSLRHIHTFHYGNYPNYTKRYMVIEKMLSGIPDQFVIAGGGPLESELKAKCEAMGLNGKVVFLGYLERASEVALPAYDIFFMPSLWEAMPIALLEAMAAGNASIATRAEE